MSFSFGRTVAGFWLASLAGFVTYGYIVARLMMEALGEGLQHGTGEAASTALALGLVGAVALGAPAALLFGGVMRRVRHGGTWRTALVTGGLLSAVAYLPFRSFAEALLSDGGHVREPALFLTIAAGSMMAGAAVGALAGRSSRVGRTH